MENPGTYPSKISAVLLLVINLSVAVPLVLLCLDLQRSYLPGVLLLLVTGLFSNHLFFTTSYTIAGHILSVKSGFIYSASIDIQSIRKISRSRSILAAPAASPDRLEIQYNKWDTVLVSPKDRAGFVNHLRQVNPDIRVE